jgi:hypothetical protein
MPKLKLSAISDDRPVSSPASYRLLCIAISLLTPII